MNEDERELRASEVRRALDAASAPWRLDDDADDDTRVPRRRTGGEPPSDAPTGDEAEPIDFRGMLRENPPADPDLARYCIDVGLLDPDVALAAERPPLDQPPVESTESQPPSGAPVGSEDVVPPLFSRDESGEAGDER